MFEESKNEGFENEVIMKKEHISKKKINEKERNKCLLNEAYYLIRDCNVPIKQVSKRLHIKYSRLLRICKVGTDNPEIAFEKYKKQGQYKKLHNRARDRIKELITNASIPL